MRSLPLFAIVLFFHSLLHAGERELKEFVVSDLKFKVLLPATTKEATQKIKGVATRAWSFESPQVSYGINAFPLPATLPRGEESDRQLVEKLALSAAAELKSKIGTKMALTQLGHPGYEFAGTLPKGNVRMRVFLVDDKVVQLIIRGEKSAVESAEANKVFQSFTLLKAAKGK